ncbi:hypothetical protein E4J89_15005 [Arthrobacter sp. CAU 1506]|uniref:hypothetical protein n=1 Tax=Arthrobacter sp. CAU 1506 TaxID=2560052 RepID=UPI0010ABEFF7|nr:hypothetical protein [Arthrobacter sp. CAU 1506]TJY67394.1 hypothetical protein E4J89_15005 [Arthrobacter sp. CAU 1506]
MTRRDLMEESALLSAAQHNPFNPEAARVVPLDGEAAEGGAGAVAGPGSSAEEAAGDDAIDAWLRFRPSMPAGE